MYFCIMKKIIIIIIALFCCLVSQAQITSTRGTDFWCTFLATNDTINQNQLSILATTEAACTVTITNPYTLWSQTMPIAAHSSHTFQIPMSQAYNFRSEQVVHKGLHITSSDSITLFMITQENNANLDIANVIPTEHLRSDYMIQTFPTNRFSSIFSVVATQDNTNIDILLNGPTLGGSPSGSTLHIALPHAGDVYSVKGLTTGTLSGTRITAQGGKKIGVFHGDVCAYIPSYTYGCTCDHLIEQAPPTDFWGTEFLVSGSNTNNDFDRVLITSLDNNCQITINGNHVSTLASGATYQYQMSSPTAVDHIQTSGRVIVNIYFPSTFLTGIGDPSMTTICPTDQSIKHIQFDAIQATGINYHMVNIICDTATKRFIRIDGNPITQFQSISNAPQYALARLNINGGYHTIDDLGGNGFIAYLYGKGPHISYGYIVGTAFRYLGKPDLLVDNIHAKNHPEGFDVCLGDTVNFSIAGNIALDTVMWDFGNNESSSENPTSYCYRDDTSSYNVSVRIVYTPDTNYPSFKTVDTLHTTIHVHPTYNFSTSDTIVQNQLPWTHNTHTFTSACDNFTFQNQTHFGCDSIERYSLFVWKNDTTRFDTIICDTILPFTWNGFTFEGPGSQNELLQNSHGADSLIIYSLDTITCTIPTTYAYFDTTVCDTLLPFLWHDTLFNIPKSYIIKTRNVEGGDSIVTLTLDTMHCSLYHPQIWVPNVFTPENDINQAFKIYYKDLIEASVVIYQRWGDFVTRFDALTESWDGTKNGIPCQQGAYVYHITYRTMEHPKEVKTLFGSILLLR